MGFPFYQAPGFTYRVYATQYEAIMAASKVPERLGPHIRRAAGRGWELSYKTI